MNDPMRTVRKRGRPNLFFMEMIIVLLFFSIASAVILRSFASADRLAEESRQTESISFFAQSAAEIYNADADISRTAEKLVSDGFCVYGGASGPSSATLLMDNDVKLEMSETPEEYDGGCLKILEMEFTDEQGNVIYRFRTGAYIPGRAVTDGE